MYVCNDGMLSEMHAKALTIYFVDDMEWFADGVD